MAGYNYKNEVENSVYGIGTEYPRSTANPTILPGQFLKWDAATSGVTQMASPTDIRQFIGVSQSNNPADSTTEIAITPTNLGEVVKQQGVFTFTGTAAENYNPFSAVQLGATPNTVKLAEVPTITTAAPVVAGATIPAGNYIVAATYFGNGWETTAGPDVTQAVAAGQDLQVVAPAAPADLLTGNAPAIGLHIYATIANDPTSKKILIGTVAFSSTTNFHLAADLLVYPGKITPPAWHGLAIGYVKPVVGQTYPIVGAVALDIAISKNNFVDII